MYLKQIPKTKQLFPSSVQNFTGGWVCQHFSSSPLWGSPPNLPSNVTANSYLRKKAIKCDANHPPASSSEVKNAWTFASILHTSCCGAQVQWYFTSTLFDPIQYSTATGVLVTMIIRYIWGQVLGC